MLKRYKGVLISVMALAILTIGSPIQATVKAGSFTGVKKSPHVNVAIFHKINGHDSFVYPEFIGKDDILHVMSGKAQFISINHTAGLRDNDVLTIGNDVLREGAVDFEDFGVDCQLVVHITNADVSLSGMCQILLIDQDGREIDHKGIVKPITMHSDVDWQLIYYDAEDGIAIYADEEIGLE